MSDSELVTKGPCAACGSSDGNATYTDGHSYCFVCGEWQKGEGDGHAESSARPKRVSGLLTGEIRGLRVRKITDETARKFGYMMGKYHGKDCQIAPYYNAEGVQVAQHLRLAGKEFPWLGESKDAMPFGYQAFDKRGKMLVLTEGEIDAMSFSQVQGNKYPVWSIGSGAGPQIRKYIAERRDLFLGFDKVVLMFDSDEKGREAALVAAEVIGPRAHIAELPLKDASEMLVAGRTEEMVNAMWRAKPHRPDGVVSMSDILPRINLEPVFGKSWSLPTLTALTYGRRQGEVGVVAGGVGTGKTDFLLQEVAHAVTEHNDAVGLFFLETPPPEVVVRLAGKIAQKTFHIPDGSWTVEGKREALEALAATDKVFLYDSVGLMDWDIIKERVRFLAHAHDVRYFVIDNLTAFAVGADDERRELERVMGEAAGLALELGAFIWIVSHLATPEGTPHENGGTIMLRHLKGSRGIAAFAHLVFGIERNQQAAEESERLRSTLRGLKDRFTGRSLGKTILTQYDPDTGILSETGPTSVFREEAADDTPQSGDVDDL